MDKTIAIYDVEVFKHDAIIVVGDENGNILRYWHNDFTGLKEFVNGHVMVGYNNYHYDDYILTYMLSNKGVALIKELNDCIIRGDKPSVKVSPLIESLDCFQQIDISYPSLKKIEGNMGEMILESEVSFDIDRPLTEDELEETIYYCSHDVKMTAKVYQERKHNYFGVKGDLVEMLGKKSASKWNTTTISANILLDRPLTKWAGLRVDVDLYDLVHEEVRDMWLQDNRPILGKRKIATTTVDDFDNEITFGFGGLHGVHKNKKRFENVVLWDVTSMYPNIVILLDVLGGGTKRYQGLLQERVRIKHSDKARSDLLKLVLNSVYGNLGNKYSLLHNPRALSSVCIYGQIALYELGRRLSQYAEIVQLNTDGVAFIPFDEGYKGVKEGWENDFKLSLEEDLFKLWIQRDVNNYIAVTDKGKIKVKGGDVGRYNGDSLFKNNNTRIVDIAIVEHLVNGRDVLDVICEHLGEPKLFQYILQAGSTYLGTFDADGRQYNKINRVFATRREGVCLQKKRQDGGLVRFADAPDKMVVFNDACDKFDDFETMVDINHYYKLINKKLKAWKGI